MSIFRRKNTTNDSIPEDLQPYYQGKGSAWQRWIGPVLRGALLLALLGLIVWGGIWGINKLLNRNDTSGKTATSNASTQKKSDTQHKSNTSQKTSPQSPSPAPTPTPSTNAPSPVPTPVPTPAPSTSSSTPSGQLANTGPGEVIAAFFGTIIIATLAYYFVSAYRVSDPSRN